MTATEIKRPVPEAPNALRDWFTSGLRAEIESRGLPVIEGDEPAERGGIALHPVDIDAPKSFRRKNRAVFVVGIGEGEGVPEVPLATLYPLQLRSLGNMFFLLIPDHVTQQHLEILSEIAEFFSDEAIRTALLTDPDAETVYQRIINWQPSLQALG